MTPITTTILYDMSGRKKKQRKLVLSKQESTSYSFGAHLSFNCIQFDKKWTGLWGIFLGCILCSLFSWPGLLVTLPLTHSLTSRHLDIWDIWVMRSHALINKNKKAKTIRMTTRGERGGRVKRRRGREWGSHRNINVWNKKKWFGFSLEGHFSDLIY